jgi:hypothetical protein
MNERLQHNMTPNKMLLDVNVSIKKKCLKKYKYDSTVKDE